jgi:hypothetical protein
MFPPQRLRLSASLLLGICCPVAFAKTRHAAPPHTPDANYSAALAVADRFLQAWQAENQEDGLLLLSDAAKANISEEGLQAFFEHGAAAAYEIERGRTLKDGRYTFPVVLFEAASGAETAMRPHVARIIIARTGKHEWAVDRLP